MATKNTKPTTKLTNMDEVKQVFSRFDVNGDGKITAMELVDVMKTLGSDTSLDEVNRIMVDIDTDCDGFINLEEFAGFCKGNADDEDDGGIKELQDAFKLYDLNKNRLISAAELHQILSRLGESCSVGDCANMINSVDSDFNQDFWYVFVEDLVLFSFKTKQDCWVSWQLNRCSFDTINFNISGDVFTLTHKESPSASIETIFSVPSTCPCTGSS